MEDVTDSKEKLASINLGIPILISVDYSKEKPYISKILGEIKKSGSIYDSKTKDKKIKFYDCKPLEREYEERLKKITSILENFDGLEKLVFVRILKINFS